LERDNPITLKAGLKAIKREKKKNGGERGKYESKKHMFFLYEEVFNGRRNGNRVHRFWGFGELLKEIIFAAKKKAMRERKSGTPICEHEGRVYLRRLKGVRRGE